MRGRRRPLHRGRVRTFVGRAQASRPTLLLFLLAGLSRQLFLLSCLMVVPGHLLSVVTEVEVLISFRPPDLVRRCVRALCQALDRALASGDVVVRVTAAG